MTGEVKRYAFYDRHTGCQVDPTEILPGDTTNDDTFIANADHLAVVEGLRAQTPCGWLRRRTRDGKRRSFYDEAPDADTLASAEYDGDEIVPVFEAMRGGDET